MSVLSGLSRSKSSAEVPKELGLAAFSFGSKGEEEYLDRLVALNPLLAAVGAGRDDIDERVMCFGKTELCVDVRDLERLARDIGPPLLAAGSGLGRRRDTRLRTSERRREKSSVPRE